MEDQQQDVIQAETTAEASSAANETQETTQEATQEDSNETKTVPYDRFSEVLTSKKELERRLSEIEARQSKVETSATPANPQDELVKQQLNKYLKELGYISKAELEEKEADKQLDKTIKTLEKTYSGTDGRPKFEKTKVLEFAQSKLIGDLETAYKVMHEAQLMDYAIKQAMSKTKGVASESSDGSGSASAGGVSNDDLMKRAEAGDQDAINTLIRRTL